MINQQGIETPGRYDGHTEGMVSCGIFRSGLFNTVRNGPYLCEIRP